MERMCLDAVPEPLWRQESADWLRTICVATSGSAAPRPGSPLPSDAGNIKPSKYKNKSWTAPELLPGQRERQAREAELGLELAVRGVVAVSGGCHTSVP